MGARKVWDRYRFIWIDDEKLSVHTDYDGEPKEITYEINGHIYTVGIDGRWNEVPKNG